MQPTYIHGSANRLVQLKTSTPRCMTWRDLVFESVVLLALPAYAISLTRQGPVPAHAYGRGKTLLFPLVVY
jgi:hypothetical protein